MMVFHSERRLAYLFSNAGQDDQESDEQSGKEDVDENVEHIIVDGTQSVGFIVEKRAACVAKGVEPLR